MSDITHHNFYTPAPNAFGASIAGLRAGIASYRETLADYRRRRAIYKRTLRELQSYRPRELQELRIDPTEFEAIAREHAGW